MTYRFSQVRPMIAGGDTTGCQSGSRLATVGCGKEL